MKKGIFSLMMGLLLAFTGVLRADEVTIGDPAGTNTSSYLPVYSLYNYSFTQQIYTADEIGTAGTINSITMWLKNSSSYARNIQIYMKNADASSFATTSSWIPMETADLVGTGTIAVNSSVAPVTFTLSQPFAYDGSNLVICVSDVTGSWSGGAAGVIFNGSQDGALYAYRDASAYNAAAPGVSGTLTTSRNVVRLDITPGDTPQGSQLSVDPNPVDFGARPNNCWMRPMVATLTNEGPQVGIYGVDVDNNYFVPEELEIPFTLARNESVELNLGWTSAPEGQVDGLLVIDGQSREAFLFDMTAYAYEPVEPDVWEMARVISNPEDYRDTPTTVTLYNNYLLPPTDVEDGIDAVYKVTFDHDVMLNGNVVTVGGTDMAENGKMAIYTQAGIDEVGGPDLDNNYTGPTVSSSEPMEMTAYPEGLDGTTTVGTLPMYGLYADAYTRSQYVIPATEIAQMAGCPINSLTYYTASTPTPWQSNFQVYLTEVNYTTVSSLIDPATATTVYTGQLVIADGMMHIDFATPYQYNGGNLLIGMDCLECNNYSSCYFKCVAMTGAGMYAYNYSAPTFTSPYTVNYAPTTTFGYMGRGGNRAEEVVFSEDFESGSATGWEIDNEGANGWHVAGYDGSGHYAEGSYAMFNFGSSAESGNYDDLYSPVINLTWASEASVSFDYILPSWLDDINEFTLYITDPDHSYFYEVGNYSTNVASWTTETIDLSDYCGQEIVLNFYNYNGFGYCTAIDNVVVTADIQSGPLPPTPEPGDMLITNMTMLPGTYYIAASSTADAWDVILNASELPCPDEITAEANCVAPLDDEDGIDPSSVTLKWHLSPYTTEYRLVFGSTYYCEDVLVDWTRDLAESYTVTGLFNNTNYFWRIEERNDGCPQGIQGPVWGFTTTFNAPTNLHATNANGNNIYEGETLHLAWNAIVDRTFRMYNIYMDGELIGQTPSNPDPNATTTFDVEGLTYNMDGHIFWVTAYYDEGESRPSNPLVINISGNGRVAGHVFEQDGITGIANATVTFNGTDEFGRTRTFDFITDATGAYGGDLLAGNYNGKAECNGYQTVNAPVCGNPVEFTYAQTTEPVDFVMDEVYTPVAEVIAEYYPDPEDPESPYVKVYWGWNIMSAMIEDFETGDFSQYDWNIPAQYPFEITTTNPYEGAYCMQSTNYNVASSTSSIDVTVEIPRDGLMSFYKRISCESSFDHAEFYIDGAQVATFTGTSGWGVKEVAVTEGTHNFKWAYTKDSSVNSGEDRFFIDYIDFIHDAQPVGAGWHTYLEGEFDNAYVSNVGTPSWGYEYPASVISSYAGMNMTKVALFSDDMYGAVGGTFTCNVYQGGATPAAGTLVSTITVDVPANVGDWVEFDLTTPVHVTNDPLYVLWTADVIGGLGYPAGCASHPSTYGDWWNNGQDGWQHMGDCTWTMKNYFSDRSGRGFWASNAEANQAIQPMGNLDSKLRTYAKGEEANSGAVCINPNATFKATANSNDRSFQYFRVYRTDCYNDGPYTEENTVVCCCELHDTLYIDVEWPELAPGVYKWGVGCVYGGNRGELVESPIAWANVNVPQAYDRDAVKLAAEQNHAEISCKEYVNAEGTRAPWDLMGSMNAYEAAQYGVATDGNNIYTCNWGYGSATYNFCKYDMQGNFVEGFNIAGCGTIRDLDYDGQYFYGGANGSTLYCMDLANHTLVSTISTGCSAIRHCSYDPQNDGFWVGGWSDLMLINRNGQVIANAPAPTSCGGSGYYEDEAGNGHVYLWCEPQSVYDYDIAANSINYINNFTNIPGWDGSSTAGGAFVGEYNGKVAFFCNIQQDPNLIGIFELRDAGTPGPDPQGDPIQEERESPIVWSNCLDKDMYLNGAVDITVLLNSADSPEGVNVSFTNLNEGEQELYPVAPVTLDGTGYYAWDTFRRGDYVVNVTMGDAYEPITDTVSIWDATSLRYVMIEIIYGVSDLYVSQTGWAMWEGEGPVGPVPPTPGESATITLTVGDVWGDGSGYQMLLDPTASLYGSVIPETGALSLNCTGNEGIYDQFAYKIPENADGNCTTSNIVYNNSVTIVVPAGTYDWCITNPTPYDRIWIASANGNVGGRQNDYVFEAGKTYEFTVSLGSNGNDATDVTISGGAKNMKAPLACGEVKNFDDVTPVHVDYTVLPEAQSNGERHLEGYKVLCTSIDGEPIFSGNTEHNFIQLPVDELVEGDHYVCKVAAIYSTGMSAWSEAEWMYRSCENYGEAQNVAAEGQTITWEYPAGPVPPPPGPGDEFTVDFENGMPAGWTTLDANNDGYNWVLGTQVGGVYLIPGASLEGSGHNSSYDMICSGSYDNNTYNAITPDNYLVSPQVTLASGSTFSFWACAQDGGYPAEHFGVFVSDNGTDNWTSVQEWTMTSKSGSEVMSIGRGGNTRAQGSWHQYTVDLSAFAGQKYIAIRHFNCNDQFLLDVDDIELAINAKSGNRDEYIQYCTETYDGAVGTGGGQVWWANMFPATSLTAYAGQNITKVGQWVSGPDEYGNIYDGTYNVEVYVGGSATAPGTLAASGSMYITGDNDWHDIELNTPVAIDGTQNIWVVFNANGIGYPMCGCAYVGEPNSDLLSLDGSTWEHALDYSLPYTWMIRAFVTGGSPVPPTPTGEVIGAMIFRDGEWLAEVAYPTSEYTDEEAYGEHEYCVRIIYNGTAVLPDQNEYYSMSCPVCVGGDLTCEPGDPIRGEYVWNNANDFGALISWGEQVEPIAEWLYYDNGINEDAIGLTSGGSFYWGIMIPASQLGAYNGCSLTKVSLFDYTAHTGKALIYMGGTSAPGTLVYQQAYTMTGSMDYVEVNLDAPVALDVTQNLWIIFNNDNGQYVASCCANTGDANGRWISLDGASWDDVAALGLSETWQIRGYVTNMAKGTPATAIEVPALNGTPNGILANAGISKQGNRPAFANRAAEIVKYNIYRSTDNVNYELIASVDAIDGTNYYEYFDATAAGLYYYQVRALYSNGCESEPAASEANPANNYVIVNVTSVAENGEVALYPNPTNGNITIQAQNMNRITVVSVLGQVVYDAEVEGSEYHINMAQFNAGVYMVRIATENGVSTQRVTVVK